MNYRRSDDIYDFIIGAYLLYKWSGPLDPSRLGDRIKARDGSIAIQRTAF